MWALHKPSDEQVQRFLESQSVLNCSYPEVGLSDGGTPAGYNIDHNRILLGNGPAVFASACDAVRHWQMFPAPWTQIRPVNAPIELGTTVAMLAHVFGVWWLNACRIVRVFDEAGPVRRFGFSYGTLPQHVECGEERFTVEWLRDDSVWYDIRAFSRPRYWLVRLAYPLARRIQKRFVVASQARMRQAVRREERS
jgi:uncharacterized protein (UPF0548 family)